MCRLAVLLTLTPQNIHRLLPATFIMARTTYPVASSPNRRYRQHNTARPVVDPVHLPAAAQSTPAFDVGQQVGVQLRRYIWVPGTIVRTAYLTEYASVVYFIQYVAADGCQREEGFLPKDVRDHE
ncbi:hypothetical protein V8D89_010355 [Ganoderma adspersum]